MRALPPYRDAEKPARDDSGGLPRSVAKDRE
jgi:hypothetical protein